mmetsp:Transcript_3901/g.12613  ORF Transcript_3901/g.12613 Transcript_3901/m.12613 type:complete len:248 (-) Transcript_3901:188-931(-)
MRPIAVMPRTAALRASGSGRALHAKPVPLFQTFQSLRTRWRRPSALQVSPLAGTRASTLWSHSAARCLTGTSPTMPTCSSLRTPAAGRGGCTAACTGRSSPSRRRCWSGSAPCWRASPMRGASSSRATPSVRRRPCSPRMSLRPRTRASRSPPTPLARPEWPISRSRGASPPPRICRRGLCPTAQTRCPCAASSHGRAGGPGRGTTSCSAPCGTPTASPLWVLRATSCAVTAVARASAARMVCRLGC